MKSLSEHLTILAATAEDIMRRPAHEIPTALPPAFAELACEIRAADGRPAEGIRTTRAGVIMVTAIEAFFAERDGVHHWQMLIGATLPILKREAWQAFSNERAARASS
jgi:hypothetical protein